MIFVGILQKRELDRCRLALIAFAEHATEWPRE